jgi:pimeloyl-ACP methyl ester carboxylesterase
MEEAAYVLVPGAGGDGWYWHLVLTELERRGHRAVAVDLPAADPKAGLAEYCDVIVSAAAGLGGGPVTVVAQSLGGFSGPLACERLPGSDLIMVNPMIPRPGEPAGEWWDNVGWQEEAQAAATRDGRPEVDPYDAETLFFHDVPGPVTDALRERRSDEASIVFTQPWPLGAWPKVPTRVLSGRDDRFFPLPLQQKVASDRLGIEAEEVPGGHLAALSQPAALAEAITRGPGARG